MLPFEFFFWGEEPGKTTQPERYAMYCTVCRCPGTIRLCRSYFAIRMGHIFKKMIEAYEQGMQ